MKEFFTAALPWICMGVAVAVALTVLRHEKAKRDLLEQDESLTAEEKQKKAAQGGSYMVWGMCMGECAGIAIAEAADASLALGISLGMVAGIALGKLLDARKR